MAENTINTMEVLATKPISELASEVIIKVCYVSEQANPNKTVINREVGKEIAATLPGAPIAGFFNKEAGDFEEHSRRITFKDGEFEIEDITRPYGFVCPTTAPWYQDFEENGEVRTYLMCVGYMWTRQYDEASAAVNKGQSMELDENAMAGYYKGNVFVFTEATLDKLCILGDAYAPCFPGASIMANYAKGFNSLAEQIENTIGRRYYVMANQLVQKPEGPITLKYALELGWNLTDAIYAQLVNRGAADTYWVKGIYAEEGNIFTILENRDTLELVRCDVTITGADTIELGTEMQQVKMSWTPTGPAAPEPVEALSGSGGIATDGPAVGQFTAQDPPPAGEATPPPATSFADDDEKCPECGNDPCTCDDDDETDYKAKYTELAGRLAELQTKYSQAKATLTENTATITGLTTSLGTFRAQAEAAAEVAKQAVITEYTALLSEEDMAPILEYAKTNSAEAVEAKCAIAFAKKAKSNPTMFQLNLQGLDAADANLPDFMKQAMEIETTLDTALVLKA